MAQDCCKTTEVKEYPRLTHAVLQRVNFLLHWISAALATVQGSLVFSPYLTHKKQQEYGRRKNFVWGGAISGFFQP